MFVNDGLKIRIVEGIPDFSLAERKNQNSQDKCKIQLNCIFNFIDELLSFSDSFHSNIKSADFSLLDFKDVRNLTVKIFSLFHEVRTRKYFDQSSLKNLTPYLEELYVSQCSILFTERLREECGLVFDELNEGHQLKNITCLRSFIKNILIEYQVISRFIYTTSSRCNETTKELLEHALSDMLTGKLEPLGVKSDDQITRIEHGLGDRHHFGKTVSCVNFLSGKRLIYKPTTLQQFEILYALNEAFVTDNKNALQIPKFIQRDSYGWVEFIEHEICAQTSYKKFYEASGSNLAWLFFIGGIDFIEDNVIAKKQIPYLIDIECILNPTTKIDPNNLLASAPSFRKFLESVINVGLLPAHAVGSYNSVGPIQSALYQHPDKDMQSNFPHTNVEHNQLAIYRNNFLEAFNRSYRYILKNKSRIYQVISETLALLPKCECRFLLRHTLVYDRLLNEARFPEYWKEQKLRDELFGALKNAHNDVEFPLEIIESEIEQISSWDIPIFYSNPVSNDLLGPNKNVICENYFDVSGIETTRIRLNDACNAELQYQNLIIDRSIDMFCLEVKSNSSWSGPIKLAEFHSNPEQMFFEKAKQIADYIISQCVFDNSGISILDANIGRLGEYQQGPKPLGLYDGCEGVVIFLIQYARLTNNTELKNLISIHCKSLVSAIQLGFEKSMNFFADGLTSSFSAPLSIILLLETAYSYGLVEKGDLLTTRQNVFDWLNNNIESDLNFDILHGVSGTIPLLLDISKIYSCDKALWLAKKCGDHLLKNAVREGGHCSWKSRNFDRIGGFSHGSGGIAWSLFALAKKSNSEKYQSYAKMALSHDRSFFDSDMGAWRDQRETVKRSCGNAWCHGAPGIGLSRLLISDYYEDNLLIDEVKMSIKFMRQMGVNGDDMLCHGSLGNLEILRALANFVNDDEAKEISLQAIAAISNTKEKPKDWGCYTNYGTTQKMGLFWGLSGIGYSLLRWYQWNETPAVLAITLPNTINSAGIRHLHNL